MELRPEEITQLIKTQIQNFDSKAKMTDTVPSLLSATASRAFTAYRIVWRTNFSSSPAMSTAWP